MAGCAPTWRTISCACARARSPCESHIHRSSETHAAARRAADTTERHRDRALAARSLHDLRQAYFAPRPARSDRHAAGAADRGTVIHAAVGAFTQKYANELPPDPVAALIAIGERQFAALADYPEARAFWWPRFQR